VGDIVVMHKGGHVEIITDFTNIFIRGKGFCSRGAGRGNRDEMGKKKCFEILGNADRDLDNSSNSFYHL
jgi:hypothetical protein